jgi:hypothetical protein
MTKLSRRQFFASALAPFAVGTILAPLRCPPAESPDPASDAALDQEGLPDATEPCKDCDGWGRLICPACDGTGRWSDASESAGLHQREAARSANHCAWCDEWGEIQCPQCEGMAVAAPHGKLVKTKT